VPGSQPTGDDTWIDLLDEREDLHVVPLRPFG
jgi:hypothetical protein